MSGTLRCPAVTESPTTPRPVPRTRGAGGPWRRIGFLTWIVFGLVPVLWVVELTGPEWLNLVLRVTWVLVAVGTVALGIRIALGQRAPGPDRGRR